MILVQMPCCFAWLFKCVGVFLSQESDEHAVAGCFECFRSYLPFLRLKNLMTCHSIRQKLLSACSTCVESSRCVTNAERQAGKQL